MPQLLSFVLLVIFYLVVSVVALESWVRLFNLAAPPEAPGYFWRVPDALTGWGLEPGAHGRWFNPLYEFDVEVQINDRGLRSPPEIGYEKGESVFRVVTIGDSFVEGVQVALAETFPQQLGRLLNGLVDEANAPPLRLEVINAGVGGWGTDQQLLWLRHEGVHYQPDLVLLAFFPANDFINNYQPLEFANVGAVRKPWFRLEEGDLVLHNFPFDPSEARETARTLRRQITEQSGNEALAADQAPSSRPLAATGEWLYAHSALFRYIDPRIRVTWPAMAVRLARWGLIEPGAETKEASFGPDYIPLAYGVYQQPVAPEWEAAHAVTGALFAELRREAETMGARTAALLLPAQEETDDRVWQSILDRYPAMQAYDWSPEQPNRKAAELLAASGIPVLDLWPLFRQGIEGGATLYFHNDGHWTQAGHALAGAALADFLVRSELIPPLAGATVPVVVPAASGSWWHWLGWIVLALLGVSLAWSLYQTGPLAWLRNQGVSLGTTGELLWFLVRRRRFVLLPLVVILLLFGGLLVIAQASVVGPFIYTLF